MKNTIIGISILLTLYGAQPARIEYASTDCFKETRMARRSYLIDSTSGASNAHVKLAYRLCSEEEMAENGYILVSSPSTKPFYLFYGGLAKHALGNKKNKQKLSAVQIPAPRVESAEALVAEIAITP